MLADNSEYGSVLVAANGMTLYVFDKDSPGVSACSGSCLEKWPALTVASASDAVAGAGITGELGTITREDDGSTQVTINGMPLYYYYEDKQAGDTTGQAVGDVWWMVGPDGNKISG
jgi:predicted lipoprotein with Yx(FWY)xxD motif